MAGNNRRRSDTTGSRREMRVNKVELYEDNAGHLFLVHGFTVWSELEQTGSTFREDAKAVLAHDTDGWTIETFDIRESRIDTMATLVASYRDDGIMSLRMHSVPGAAASDYILGELADRHPEWVPSGDTVTVYREGKAETVYPFVEMV
jgi:hypothetical protein